MLIPVIKLLAGAALLVKGADMLVNGGEGIALKSGVSALVVGLTVVAFGTSAPELAVSLTAALRGSGDVSFGNVVGSNIANIALILGMTALIRPVVVNRSLIRRELPFLIFISVITCVIGYRMQVGRFTALGLLVLFAYYLFTCFKSPPSETEVDDETARKSYGILFLLAGVGVAGLGFGGMFFVDGAREIALKFGVSEAIIGLTVVALGTSLPELVTSIVAALRNQADISVGNIVGSNIFNILLVIGASASIRPYDISPDRYLFWVGLPLMMLLAIILLPIAITGKQVSRLEGGAFTIVYILAIVLAVFLA